jgi:HAD superfamily hydrolase (TIGR01549 family)
VSRTLLLDLDDTLLGNDIGEFLPVYLKALGKHLAIHASPERLVPILLSATQAMIQNNRPDITLKEVFEAAFFSALGVDREAMQADIDEFYASVFPTLRSLTQPRSEAVSLVEYALECGYQIVIATNPLFPRTAILQRLQWAQLSPEDYPFSLIASYETFHFAKPNPAFFAEILGRLGWPSGPVLMVGDSLENDIHASRNLGLAAYWISTDGVTPPRGEYAPTATGSTAEVVPWLDSVSAELLKPDYTSIPAMLTTLRATPAALDALLNELPASQYTQRPEAEEWSLTEILCHLRDVEEEVNWPRFNKVNQENDPFLPGMVTDPWAEERKYFCQDGSSALQSFTAARLKVLDLLEDLDEAGWTRSARHAIFGPTYLKELVGISASHDRLHLQQFRKTLNRVLETV